MGHRSTTNWGKVSRKSAATRNKGAPYCLVRRFGRNSLLSIAAPCRRLRLGLRIDGSQPLQCLTLLTYQSAKRQYQQALDRREDLGRTHPDGALTYRLALRNLDRARGNYNRALLRFKRLILHGEVPAEDDVSATPRKEQAIQL